MDILPSTTTSLAGSITLVMPTLGLVWLGGLSCATHTGDSAVTVESLL